MYIINLFSELITRRANEGYVHAIKEINLCPLKSLLIATPRVNSMPGYKIKHNTRLSRGISKQVYYTCNDDTASSMFTCQDAQTAMNVHDHGGTYYSLTKTRLSKNKNWEISRTSGLTT